MSCFLEIPTKCVGCPRVELVDEWDESPTPELNEKVEKMLDVEYLEGDELYDYDLRSFAAQSFVDYLTEGCPGVRKSILAKLLGCTGLLSTCQSPMLPPKAEVHE